MTTSFILGPGEEFIQCPYNTAHQITNARLITHLEKCRKAYLKNLTVEGRQQHMKICRHNASHHIPAPELRFHEARCGDAISVVRHMAYHNSEEGNRQYDERRKQDSSSGWSEVSRSKRSSSPSSHRHSRRENSRTEPKPLKANDWGLEEEDWEADCAGHVPGYDPEVKLKNEVVIYNPSGLTKSERKKFRNEVRQKAAEMSVKGEPVEFPTARSFDIDVKPNMNDLKIKEEGRKSPPEPGEIDDDDEEDVKPNIVQKSGSSGGRCDDPHHNDHQDFQYDRRDSHNGGYSSRSDPRPSSTSSSSRSHSHSTHSKSSSSRTGNSRTQRVHEDPYPDSDDFEGIDPYI